MRIYITREQAEALFKRFNLLSIDLNEDGWLYCIGDEGAPVPYAISHSLKELVMDIKPE